MNNWDSIILDGAWRLTLIHDADLRTMQQDVIQAVREEKLPAIPATVPGNFELDLQAAGELPDVFFGDNILKLDAYEDSICCISDASSSKPRRERPRGWCSKGSTPMRTFMSTVGWFMNATIC